MEETVVLFVGYTGHERRDMKLTMACFFICFGTHNRAVFPPPVGRSSVVVAAGPVGRTIRDVHTNSSETTTICVRRPAAR